MLKEEVVTAFGFLTRLNEFFKRGNKPIFCGCDFAQRIDGKPTIRGYKLAALPMLDILDVGEARVFQFFCYCVGHDRLIAWFRSAGAAWGVTGNKVRDGKNAPHLQAGHKTGHDDDS